VNRIWAALFVTATVAIASGQNTGSASGQNSTQNGTKTQQPAQNTTQPAQSRPRRAVAKLDGFDLAPESASANQIGGASRSVSGKKLVAYAPHKGRVFTLRPSFSWQGSPSATYKFHLQDVTGQVSWEREVTGTTLDYPADAPPLEAGKTYMWRVSPDSDMLGAPTGSSMIVILDNDERSQIESAEHNIEGTSLDADMARAQLYFDRRLWYDAVMAYTDLIARYPGESKLYLMRGSLYDQLPVTAPLADRDFAHAE
jgi:hypothetical protein